MAKTLYELAMEYLNQGMPDITQAPRTTTPTTPTTPPPATGGPANPFVPIPKAISNGGGDGFSVYNPDLNSISNKNYSPYAYRQAEAKSGVGIPSGILSDSSFLYPPQTKVGNMINNSFIGKGLDYLGSKMPVNKRAILENELAGQGIMVDDIGRIVSGPGSINTAENIMSGYNASLIDADTIQGRLDTINAKMSDKINTKTGISFKQEKINALNEFAKKNDIALDKTTTIFNDKSLAKDPTFKSLSDKIAIENAINLAKEDDEDIDIFDPKNKTKNPNVFTQTPTDVFYDDYYPDVITNTDNNDFDGLDPITGGTNLNDFDGLDPITGGTNLNDFDGLDPITGGTNLNDYDGVGPITGGTNLNDYDGVGPITGGTNLNDYTGGNITGGTNLNDYSGVGGGYDFSDFDEGDDSKADPGGTGNFSDAVTGNDTSPGATGGEGGNNNGGGGGTHCCTAANERGDMTLLEVKKLRVWHRKQSKIWQRGYDVWGRVMADNLVSKYKWSSDRVRDFYNHKIYGKRTIGSTFADFCIYPMSMVIGCILTVMPPILGYQENKKNG